MIKGMMPAKVIAVSGGEINIRMTSTIRMNMTPRTNMETFVPNVS